MDDDLEFRLTHLQERLHGLTPADRLEVRKTLFYGYCAGCGCKTPGGMCGHCEEVQDH